MAKPTNDRYYDTSIRYTFGHTICLRYRISLILDMLSNLHADFAPCDLVLDAHFLKQIVDAGGSSNFLYALHSNASPPEGGKALCGALGKLEIRWRGNLGKLGRLQTQQIMANAANSKDVELLVTSLPHVRGAAVPCRDCMFHSTLRSTSPLTPKYFIAACRPCILRRHLPQRYLSEAMWIALLKIWPFASLSSQQAADLLLR